MEAPPRGPYIRAALFAENILEEKDGVKTAVRIIDQFTAKIQGQEPPEDMPAITHQLNALISLKPGEARGRQTFSLTMEKPDGQRKQAGQGTIHFQGTGNRGVDLRMNLGVTFDQEGLYWFDFELEGQLLTRMPFEVLYNRVVTAPRPEPPQG